jgi:hypothetical protein
MDIEDTIQNIVEITGDNNFKRKTSLVFEEYGKILVLLGKEAPYQTAINQIQDKRNKLFEYSKETRSRLKKKPEKLNQLKREISNINYAEITEPVEKIKACLKAYEVNVIETELDANKGSYRLLSKIESVEKLFKLSSVVIPMLLTIFWGLIMFTIGLNIATKNIQNWILGGIIIPSIAWMIIEFKFTPWFDQRINKFKNRIIKKEIGHLCNKEILLQSYNEIDRYRNKILNPNNDNSVDAKSSAAE